MEKHARSHGHNFRINEPNRKYAIVYREQVIERVEKGEQLESIHSRLHVHSFPFARMPVRLAIYTFLSVFWCGISVVSRTILYRPPLFAFDLFGRISCCRHSLSFHIKP